MPLLTVLVDNTELGYRVACYEKGVLIHEVLMADDQAAEFYAESFIEQNGCPFPPLFDYVH